MQASQIKASSASILCTVSEAASMIGRGETFIWGAITEGRIEAVKSGKRTLVVVDSLRAYAASLPRVKAVREMSGR
jgi:excisionase family DNA binding protein